MIWVPCSSCHSVFLAGEHGGCFCPTFTHFPKWVPVIEDKLETSTPLLQKRLGTPLINAHISLSREMWQPVLIRVQKRNCSVVKENVNFLDGQAHFEAHLPNGLRVKAVVSDNLAVKSFTETYKQWPLASKKFVKSSKDKVVFKFFSSKASAWRETAKTP